MNAFAPDQVTDIHLVALPETAGSSLYGMVDVLSSAGIAWNILAREGKGQPAFRVNVVATARKPFLCGNRVPVQPDYGLDDAPFAPVIVLSELWLEPDESLTGRHPELVDWLCRQHRAGAILYSVCSGSILLAETGLLDGCHATSHWAYEDLFRRNYPGVKFDPAPNLVYADPAGRIVTAGGTTSWHDLALHIISRHASPGEALRIAKVYLLKFHDEGELPYTPLVRPMPHGDSVVRRCEEWLQGNYRDFEAITTVTARSGIPERTFKRRFKAATGISLIEYLQNLRVEEAKRLLESSNLPIDEISEEAGYSDASFFRRLFKRLTGLTPSRYRRMFQPILAARGGPPDHSAAAEQPSA
jgi:transcriptional regulator GlxA family with amidase domain